MNFLVPKAHAAATDFNFNNLINPLQQPTDASTLVNQVLGWIYFIAGVLAVIYLIYSGILYITAAGNPDAAKKGQQGIINAIIGIVIVILAYVITTAVASVLK